jgi:hypothetical protein
MKKRGSKKIDLACRQAVEDGFDYIWIDTICIDKTSSAELSESINSMFKYYSLARICYAYLVDVSIPEQAGPRDEIMADVSPTDASLRGREEYEKLEDDDDPQDPEDHVDVEPSLPWESPFAASRWLTRGWTLQELIAPKRVDFFDYGWKHIGTKVELLELLSDTAGIGGNVLSHPGAVYEASVTQRMFWAANRRTQRDPSLFAARNIRREHAPVVRRGRQSLYQTTRGNHQGFH